MTQHLVRYTVKADQVAHNEELVRAVFAELDQVQPPGLRYATFRLDDGVTFIHLVCHDKAEHGRCRICRPSERSMTASASAATRPPFGPNSRRSARSGCSAKRDSGAWPPLNGDPEAPPRGRFAQATSVIAWPR